MRVNPWLENTKRNLIPKSVSDEFEEALSEWFFTGEVESYDGTNDECELCEHLDLLSRFEIKNKNNDNLFWVGSSCILKFQNIDIYDADGKEIIEKSSRRQALQDALKKQIENIMLDPLRELWKKEKQHPEKRSIIESKVFQYKDKSGFSPLDILWLFEQLNLHEIQYEPRRYRVSLRSDRYKWELERMSKEERKKLIPCLTPEQAKRFSKLISSKET